jgi:hypothetical protein
MHIDAIGALRARTASISAATERSTFAARARNA